MITRKTRIREVSEWTNIFWNQATTENKPRLLLVGDSIVVGHSGQVHERLKERFCVDHFATAKCVSDELYMTELNYVLGLNHYAIVVFNNGLHGFDISEDIYAENLLDALGHLKKRAARLVWRNSTPMRVANDLSKRDPERTPRILERNRLASAFAAELGVPELDLHSPMDARPDLFSPDGVHYTQDGQKLQAELIVDFIDGKLA